MLFDDFCAVPRCLLEVPLKPLQGSRFQPTGFPDLGAATFRAGGTTMLLLESAQSVANRLEAVCWDEAEGKLVPPLEGMPYVVSMLQNGSSTNSLLEAHRLNSPYIVNSEGFGAIKEAVGYIKNEPYDRSKLISTLVTFDPNSLIHGIFFEKIAGELRIPRCVSGFIEAKGVEVVASGGVKVDRVRADTKESEGKAGDGYGHIPFHRDEYTADEITAYFSVDLAQLRGYRLPQEVETFLLGLIFFKIQRFLTYGLRLRTACDLEVDTALPLVCRRPQGVELPPLDDLERALPKLIQAAAGYFHEENPYVVEHDIKKKGKNKGKKLPESEA